MKVIESNFYSKWKRHQMNMLSKAYPNIPEGIISDLVDEMSDAQSVNPKASLHNNYTGQMKETTLINLIDWMEKVEPIIAGFGVLFKNQNDEMNPNAVMLDKMLALRKFYKNRAFTKMQELGTMDKSVEGYLDLYNSYKTDDRIQGTEKANVNSFYGGLGCATSKLYNLYTAQAVTASGQLLISTTNSAFENFGSDSNPFLEFNECAMYIENTISENSPSSHFLPEKTEEETFERLKGRFFDWSDEYTVPLTRLIGGLTADERKRVYFKNNLYEFFEIPKFKDLLTDILVDVGDFKDPNELPEEIEERLKNLNTWTMELVSYNHITYQRRYRLKNMERKTVTTIDTDSNMPYVGNWVEWVFNNICKPTGLDKTKDFENMLYATVNIMAYFMTQMVTNILEVYCENAKIPGEHQGRVNMKNEFLFFIMYLSNVKKRYITQVLLREGKKLEPDNPDSLDVKGHDFKKSSTSEESKEFFEYLIKEYLLVYNIKSIEDLEAFTIDIPGLMKDLNGFYERIIKSLRDGEKQYLAPAKVNQFESYKDPFRIRQAVAVMTWNMAYPKNQIELPDSVMVAQVDLSTEEKLNRIKETDPEVYENLYKSIYITGCPQTRKKGVYVVAIPSTVKTLPRWITENIEAEDIANKLVSKFHSVLHALGIVVSKTTKSHNTTNIVAL